MRPMVSPEPPGKVERAARITVERRPEGGAVVRHDDLMPGRGGFQCLLEPLQTPLMQAIYVVGAETLAVQHSMAEVVHPLLDGIKINRVYPRP